MLDIDWTHILTRRALEIYTGYCYTVEDPGGLRRLYVQPAFEYIEAAGTWLQSLDSSPLTAVPGCYWTVAMHAGLATQQAVHQGHILHHRVSHQELHQRVHSALCHPVRPKGWVATVAGILNGCYWRVLFAVNREDSFLDHQLHH